MSSLCVVFVFIFFLTQPRSFLEKAKMKHIGINKRLNARRVEERRQEEEAEAAYQREGGNVRIRDVTRESEDVRDAIPRAT